VTDYEKKLERMSAGDLLAEYESACMDWAESKKSLEHERLRICRRVVARRIYLASNLAA
jgi:hypothetical protein